MKKINSMDLVDMVKFNKELLYSDTLILLECIQKDVQEGKIIAAINSTWCLNTALYNALKEIKRYETQQKSKKESKKELKEIQF